MSAKSARTARYLVPVHEVLEDRELGLLVARRFSGVKIAERRVGDTQTDHIPNFSVLRICARLLPVFAVVKQQGSVCKPSRRPCLANARAS